MSSVQSPIVTAPSAGPVLSVFLTLVPVCVVLVLAVVLNWGR